MGREAAEELRRRRPLLRPRIIPCLLVRDKGLVKTVGFSEAKYVGDPLNAVRIFNEKEADELIVLDIDATANGRAPDLKTIQLWASECRMPLCYGGGVTSVDQTKAIIGLGVEKVAFGSAAVERPQLIADAARDVGSQSVVAVLDVRCTGDLYEVWTRNGTRNTHLCPSVLAMQLQERGVGEIVVNSIDRDGRMLGYDFELASKVRRAVRVPVTVLGGAGSLKDVEELISKLEPIGPIGAAAGSLFVFKGAYRAVLINYPSPSAKDALILRARLSRAG
jgi:cyclase